MLITILGAKCAGIDAIPVTVEVDMTFGIGIHLVGLADIAVKESLLRTITALQSMGFKVPGKKIVINLAPADMHKKGSGYDVPIALGILAASGQVEMPELENFVIMGELGLDGSVREVSGALPIVEFACREGKGCILPKVSAMETVEFANERVYGVDNLRDVLRILAGSEECRDLSVRHIRKSEDHDYPAYGGIMDFSEIKGQDGAKRGLEIAAAGGHNAILIGPPGSGKSSLAKALSAILPPMSTEEAIQTSKIYSVAGKGSGTGLIRRRPFRAPHYSASIPALIGGGSDVIMPGEISLAHNGVLFMDEFCEVPKRVLEALRGPMEDRTVTISRLRGKVCYPASFMLVAATNPCPCGHYGDGDKCTCSPSKRLAYLGKLSGPIMDRIDIHLWMKPVDAKSLVTERHGETSETIAGRVRKAREIQKLRFAGDLIHTNAEMDGSMIGKYCPLSNECKAFLEKLMDRMQLSARACHRIIKLARTIADMEMAEDIALHHLSEAAGYRFLDKNHL